MALPAKTLAERLVTVPSETTSLIEEIRSETNTGASASAGAGPASEKPHFKLQAAMVIGTVRWIAV